MIRDIVQSDFSGGLVTNVPPHALEEGASPSMQNVDLSESLGALVKRKGTAVEYTENVIGGFSKVSGLFQHIKESGSKYIIASAGDDIFSLTGAGTWTSIHTTASLDGADVNFATFKDLLIAVSSLLTTQKWTGSGSMSALLGSPPSNAKFIEVHKGKLHIANTSAGKSRLHYSVTDNAEDWTTTTGETGAGFIDVSPDDGDQITGLCSIGSVLIIFKRFSTWQLSGYKPSNFVLRKLSPGIGCASSRSIVRADNFAIFLSDLGVYAVNQVGVSLLSFNIKPDFTGMTNTVRGATVGGRLRSQYWLAYDSNANGSNDSAYVLDYVYGTWSKYSNINSACFLTLDDGSLLSGGSEKIIVRRHDTGTEDEATPVTMTWDSKDFDFGSWVVDKMCQDVFINANVVSGKTISFSHLVNGVLSGDVIVFSLTPAGTEDRIISSLHMLQASQGRYIRARFSNAEAAAPVKLYGFSISADIQERQN